METPVIKIDCPVCHTTIKIAHMAELKEKAIEEYDLAEKSAQLELNEFKLWLLKMSFWGWIKYWVSRHK